MKLSAYAKKIGVTYQTAWNIYKSGGIKNAYALSTGTIIVPEEEILSSEKPEKTVVYARVSSSENKSNLESQAKRVSDYCYARGYQVNSVVKEIGSGVNDNRRKLVSILGDTSVTRIVVEHKDRLTRFGFNYIKTTLESRCVIEVINEATEDEAGIVEDFVAIITSFCARIYGQRRSKRNTEKLIEELKNDS